MGISAGVDTGGSGSSAGEEVETVVDGTARAMVDKAAAGVPGDTRADSDGAANRGECDPYWAGDTGMLGRAGARPIPPAPAGASTAADGRVAGRPARAHPAVTATGRPRTTNPQKTVLGDNCTCSQPVARREKLRLRRQNRLIDIPVTR
jgi:hypothetical protein